MAKPTKDDYEAIAAALKKAGYTAKDVFPALEEAGFSVELNGETYNVYASRVIAIMHSQVDRLSLKLS